MSREVRRMKLNKRHTKEYITHLLRSLFFWTLALPMFALFRYLGIKHEIGLTIEDELLHIYDINSIFIGYAIVGFIIGLLYASIEFTIDKYISKYVPLALGLLVYTISVLFVVILASEIGIRVYSVVHDISFDVGLGWWYRDRAFWSHLIFIPFASFFFALIVIVSDKFGPETFVKVLFGHYKNPKEENRVFMFLDLKDSTTIAENVGHIRFSQLLQDCFYDLNEISFQYQAQIYQYVGDEVVLSWPFSNGVADQNCVKLFFDFQNKLSEKSSYYEDKYGVKPVFKAGLHGGIVTATEVGLFKKELAYHGDVVNTAARIQGECNRHKESILVSKQLLKGISISSSFLSKFVGKVLLKGKNKEVEIFALKLAH